MVMDFAQHVGKGFREAWRGILFRRTYKQLADVVTRTKKWYPRMFPGAKFNEADFRWTFPEGEEMLLRYMAKPEDYWEYHGHEYPWIGWNELTNWPTSDCYERMKSCSRSSTPGMPRKIRSDTNPWGRGHCVPFGDVLTPAGWRAIEDIKVGEIIYTVDKTGTMVEAPVAQIHASIYEGKLVEIEQRGLYMLCTPQHKIAKIGGTRDNPNALFSLLPFEELPGQTYIKRDVAWEGRELKTFTVPLCDTNYCRLTQPMEVEGDDFVEFMGWFLSEGHTLDRDKEFGISQTKQPHRDDIRTLLQRMGFLFREHATGFVVCSPRWWAYLQQFGKCRDKFIPRELCQLSVRQLELLITTLIKGDGHSPGVNTRLYYSLSEQLIDNLTEIAVKAGYITYRSCRPGREGIHYTLSIKRQVGGTEVLTGNHRYKVQTTVQRYQARAANGVAYNGPVYCIGINKTHSFVIRQGGSTWISGNSWVKDYFIDPAPAGVPIIESFKNPHTGKMIEMKRVRITGSVLENKTLLEADPNYLMVLEAVKDGELKKAWRYGSWDVNIGAFFSDVYDSMVHIISDWLPPKNWKVYRSMDWGSARPFSIGFWTISDGNVAPDERFYPRGALIRFREWYGCKPNEQNIGVRLNARQVAKGIIEIEESLAKHGIIVQQGPADNQIWARDNDKSVADDMEDEGVYWDNSNKDRKQGWNQMRYLFSPDNEDAPMMYIQRSCRHWIRTVPGVQRDEKDWDDIETDDEDHIADETRYMAMFKPRRLRALKLVGL